MRSPATSATVQVWAAPIRKGAETVTDAGPPAVIATPSVDNCGATSRRFVASRPAAMVTAEGVLAGVVLASKAMELTLKLPSSVVLTAAPPVMLLAMNTTSVPCPGVEMAAVAPDLSVIDQLATSDQLSNAPPAFHHDRPVMRFPIVMLTTVSDSFQVADANPPGVAPWTMLARKPASPPAGTLRSV